MPARAVARRTRCRLRTLNLHRPPRGVSCTAEICSRANPNPVAHAALSAAVAGAPHSLMSAINEWDGLPLLPACPSHRFHHRAATWLPARDSDDTLRQECGVLHAAERFGPACAGRSLAKRGGVRGVPSHRSIRINARPRGDRTCDGPIDWPTSYRERRRVRAR